MQQWMWEARRHGGWKFWLDTSEASSQKVCHFKEFELAMIGRHTRDWRLVLDDLLAEPRCGVISTTKQPHGKLSKAPDVRYATSHTKFDLITENWSVASPLLWRNVSTLPLLPYGVQQCCLSLSLPYKLRPADLCRQATVSKAMCLRC